MHLRELVQQYRALRAVAFQTKDDGQAEGLIYQCCELQLAIYHAPVNSFDDLVAKANVLTIDLKDGAEHFLPLEPASVLLMFARHIEHLAASTNIMPPGLGHVGLELRNVAANYLFERSYSSPGIQPTSGD